MNGNAHKPHPCRYCWIVSYSKGALTRHINQYHWKELEKEAKLLEAIKNDKNDKKGKSADELN